MVPLRDPRFVDPGSWEIWMLGVDFTTAPLAVRESLSYTADEARALLHSSIGIAGVQEAVVVSTCNRTEFYLAVDPAVNAVALWLDHVRRARPDAPVGDVHCVLFREKGVEAARHLFRVSCGLESSILGDVHIGGQLKQALALSGEAGTLGPVLSQVFRHAFHALKAARQQTDIGRGHASLGSAVAGLIEARSQPAPRVLLIGGGVAARDIGRQLAKWRCGNITVVNRTRARADELARQVGARAADWEALDAELDAADVLVAATAAVEPILRHAQLARCLSRRADRPLIVIDVGVPRNVEPVDGVEYVTIDDIAARRDEALARRQAAVPLVDAMVDQELSRWEKWIWTRPGEDLLRRVFVAERQERADLVDRLIAAGVPAESDALDRLIARSWGRLLHQHARRLRQWLEIAPRAASAGVGPSRLGIQE
jgi:glutamyl-tRNA reductase